MEKPRIAAPRALNAARSVKTDGESTMSMGTRPAPRKSLTMAYKVSCWFCAVAASRTMRERAWPVVPDDVMILKISSSGMLCNFKYLNKRIGSMGICSSAENRLPYPNTSRAWP